MMVEWVAFVCGAGVGLLAGALVVALCVLARRDADELRRISWPDDPMFHRGRPRQPR